MADDRDAIGGRIRAFREALGYSQDEMARWIAELVGAGTKGSRISDWENTPKRHPYVLAAIALLHPDPRACLAWLREGPDGAMPPLARPEGPPASDAERLERDGRRLLRAAEALRVLSAVAGAPLAEEVQELRAHLAPGSRGTPEARGA